MRYSSGKHYLKRDVTDVTNQTTHKEPRKSRPVNFQFGNYIYTCQVFHPWHKSVSGSTRTATWLTLLDPWHAYSRLSTNRRTSPEPELTIKSPLTP